MNTSFIPCWVTLGKLLHLSELQFSNQQTRFLGITSSCLCVHNIVPFPISFLALFSHESLSSSKILRNLLTVYCLSPQ